MIRLGKKIEPREIVYRMSADASINSIAVQEVANVMYAFAKTVNETMKPSEQKTIKDAMVDMDLSAE